MLQYIQYKELNDSSNERINFFLERLHRSYYFYKNVFPEVEVYKYFTKEQIRFILGSEKKNILSLLEQDGIVIRSNKRDSHGNVSNFYILKKNLKSRKHRPTDKRFIKSSKNYFRTTRKSLSNKALMLSSHLLKFKIDITRVEFIEWVFRYVKSKPLKKRTLDQAYGDYMEIWNLITTFNNSTKEDISELIVEDNFSGRIHTPLTSLPTELRNYIKMRDGRSVSSIDLVSSQPNILAHILHEQDSNNEFSQAFFASDDIYIDLKSKLRLNTRKDAKKVFFKSVFGDGTSDECVLFGNMYPRSAEMLWQMRHMEIPKNPSKKKHSNIAWLLQNKETEIFSEIWRQLQKRGITFFTIHDQLLSSADDIFSVKLIAEQVTAKYLKKFCFELK